MSASTASDPSRLARLVEVLSSTALRWSKEQRGLAYDNGQCDSELASAILKDMATRAVTIESTWMPSRIDG